MRRILGTAVAVGLLALAATGCSTAVAGEGRFDAAGGPLGTGGPSPTAAPTDLPTGSTGSPTGSPTDSPTGSPTDDPTQSPTDDPTQSPSGGPAGADQQAIATLAERWYHALAERDGDTVCGLMTSAAQRSAAGSSSDCETAVRQTDFTETQRDAMRLIEVDPAQVQVSGDDARIPASAFSVDGRQSTASGRLTAARAGAGWLIAGAG